MTITQQQLDEWLALCDAATPGPCVDMPADGVFAGEVRSAESFEEVARDPEMDDRPNDRRFIAEARDAVPALICEVRRLKKAFAESNHNIEQTLGKALGYPPLYPDASQVDDGAVCVGDHVAETLAETAANEINQLRLALAEWKTDCEIAREENRILRAGLGEAEDEVRRLRELVRKAFVEGLLRYWIEAGAPSMNLDDEFGASKAVEKLKGGEA